jgi:hypothetical protein
MTKTSTTLKAITAAALIALTSLATAPAASAIEEDDPGWSCVTDGNRVCGPDGDDWGHAPGCYDDGGALVASWPCSVVVNADGSSDVYTPDAR